MFYFNSLFIILGFIISTIALYYDEIDLNVIFYNILLSNANFSYPVFSSLYFLSIKVASTA
jgi:hypothetical protein